MNEEKENKTVSEYLDVVEGNLKRAWLVLDELRKIPRGENLNELKTTTCLICSKDIVSDEEDYVKIADYRKGEISSEGFYHGACYRSLLEGKELKEMAVELTKKTEKLLGDVNG